MPISKIPGLYFDETTEYELVGTGGKIPVIIGATGNSAATGYKIDGTQINKFSGWEEVNRSVANGGIGTDTSTNKLLAFLEEFFEEAEVKTPGDIGVPYIYVIDVGDGTTKTSWTNALTTAKTKPDATVEAYVGAESITSYDLDDFIAGAAASIETETQNLNLRVGFATKAGASDADLIALNPSTGGILNSRMGICEPLKFGKIVARICTAEYYIEPGYPTYRSVKPGTFLQRTKAQELALQNAGIIFNRDERVDTDTYCRINLATSTAFAKTNRPADALFHSRFIADNLLRQIFKAVYPQIKANEVVSNIVKNQTKVDAIIAEEVRAERIIPYNGTTGEGTLLSLVESDSEPYDMELIGQIQPVNCTVAINVKVTIKNPAVVATA